MAKTYQEMLKTIEEIEGTSTKVDFTTIDMSSIKAVNVKRRKPPFGSLLDTAMDIEAGRLGQIHHAKDAAPQAVQKKKARQSKKSSTKEVQQTATGGEIGSEVKEFTETVGVNANQQPGNKPVPGNKRDIELSKMSIQDQISEIRRIGEGLASNVFDKAQLKRIRKEVGALSKQAAKDAKKRAKSGKQDVDAGLAILRDQQLGELTNTLSGIK